MRQVYDYIDEHWQEALEDLIRICRQPSISAQGVGMKEAAELTASLMREYGIEPQILPLLNGGEYPVVYGELAGDSPTTILFYDHYDVQPPEPLELWTTPPFEPTVREGKLFARGVSDNKGNIVARLFAIKAFKEVKSSIPVSVKFLVEGEEEIGSFHLPAFIQENKELLKADGCIWECSELSWENRPTVVLGLKGILYVALEARGACRDVHSSMATVIPNPAWRLIWALNSLKDRDENILIEGFYDDVLTPTQREIDILKAIPSDENELKQSLKLERFLKDLSGSELKSRHLLEPTCAICGFVSGYTGQGSKTVLPSSARAKIDFRLVPNQRPQDILNKLRRHLDRHGFSDITLTSMEGENPARTSLDSPFVKIVFEAAKEVYGIEPIIVPSFAGSGPMFPFTDRLSMPVVSAGVDYFDSRAHAPDENVRISDFILGAKHIAAILNLASL
jgi:acetylornithine deacetylase/succinyl-diaminopimelate desuccinylase-like protein